jgi:hypothetical protein
VYQDVNKVVVVVVDQLFLQQAMMIDDMRNDTDDCRQPQ